MIEAPSVSRELAEARQRLLRPLLSDAITIASCDPLGTPPAPLPEESACLSPNAVEKRIREFAAGRAAAHQAMRALNLRPAPILVGPKRAPLWPVGLTGSISHCDSCALAAVGRAETFAGIGIDIEEDTPLAGDLWDSIASTTEQGWMAAQPDPGRAGKLLFSAKEAAYKAQYAISGRFFGFSGMELTFEMSAGRFTACFTSDQPPFSGGDSLKGRFAIGSEVIITAVEIPRSELHP